ncbi:MAG: hypothetical protein LBG80_04680 [Bacteroidales bacterium]|jgi:hypothetical protein|nr:hypothetical protein [Bacteroidales bacterium]
MADLTYTLNLAGNLFGKLKQINILNEEQLDKWSEVQKKVVSATNSMNNMGKSIGSMNQRISALRAQKEWIPSSNREAIRATNKEIKELEREVEKLESLNGGKLEGWWEELKTSVPALNALTNPLALAAAGTYKLTEYLGGSKQAYLEESVEVTKLSQIMKNTMGARQEEIESILELTSAQQKLGVIGDEVQLSGAQELSTYLQKSESLKKLLPAMNNMLAQQYGLNASQEQAANIGMMMGKVMEGQTQALSRYGYRFTEAEEKLLKTGTEAQRAAILYDIITNSVGNVNEAIANTPEGKLVQQANNMGDLQERVGKLVILSESAFSPVIGKVGEFMDKIITFFETHSEKIEGIIGNVVVVITGAMNVLWKVLGWVKDGFMGFINGIRSGSFVLTSLAIIIGVITTAIILYSVWTKIVAIATQVWAGAQALLNTIMTLNPIGLVIMGIVALIAIIAFVCYKIEGWGSLWEGIIGFMKFGFLGFVESVKLYFNTLVSGILTGIDLIKLGWYKFKEAIGIGDSSENQKAIAEINSSVEERQKAIAEGAGKVAEYSKKAKESLGKIEMKWDSEKTLGDFFSSTQEQLGIGTNAQLQASIGGVGGDKLDGEGSNGSKTNEAIVTGGSRNTVVNINIGDVGRQMTFYGSFSENKNDIKRELTSLMSEILGMAETQV